MGRCHEVFRVSANKSVATTEILYFYHGFSFVFLQLPWFASGSVSRSVACIAWAGMESEGVVCLLTNTILTIDLDLPPTSLFRFMAPPNRPRFIYSHSPGPTTSTSEKSARFGQSISSSNQIVPAGCRGTVRGIIRPRVCHCVSLHIREALLTRVGHVRKAFA